MAKVQQIKLLIDGVSTRGSAAPGNPSLWKAVEKSCGKTEYFRTQALHVEWNPEVVHIPSQEEWASWLSFPGLHSVEVFEDVKTVTLQVRRMGDSADSLTLLAHEILSLKGFKGVQRIWLARQTEFLFADGESKESVLVEALRHVNQFGDKSGLYNPECEEMRVLSPLDSLHWAQPIAPPLESIQEIKDQLHSFLSEGTWSALKRNYRVLQKNEWTHNVIQENVRNPSRQLTRAYALLDGVEKDRSNHRPGAPLDMLVSLPKSADSYSNLDKFRVRCENFASLFDRPLGQIVFRKSSNTVSLFDAWSPIGENQKIFSDRVKSDQIFCLLAHWDRRNPIAARRVEEFVSQIYTAGAESSRHQIEVLNGTQDWVGYSCDLLSRHNSGWKINLNGFSTILGLNSVRNPMESVALGWLTESDLPRLKAKAKSLGIHLKEVAQFDLEEGVRLVDDKDQLIGQMNASELFSSNEMRDKPTDVTWVIPDERAPMFGFDRVALFPDEYMLRVSFREKNEIEWIKELRKHSSAEGYRSLMMRNVANQSLNGYRWSNGEKIWAFAMGRNEGWGQVNPKQAALYALDSAQRTLISLGADPNIAMCEAVLSVPSQKGEFAQEFLASMALYVDGLVQGLNDGKIPLTSLQEVQSQGGVLLPEFFVKLSAPLNEFFPPPFPAFRMAGEHLYAVGPKPTFVDCGSRILNHLPRVVSNYLTQLEPVVQQQFYQSILELQKKGVIASIRPIYESGLAGALSEMCLWSKMGAQIRPGLSPVDLFSAAPGRFVVSVLPQDVSRLESAMKSEFLVPIGLSGGEKLLGLSVERIQSARTGQKVI